MAGRCVLYPPHDAVTLACRQSVHRNGQLPYGRPFGRWPVVVCALLLEDSEVTLKRHRFW